MDYLFIFLAGILGIIFGSFVNVVVFRTKEKVNLWGRSKCIACQEPIHAKDLIPVVSFFVLKQRCRHCKAVIEWQYPAVELALGILFALFYARAFLGFGVPDFVTSNEWLALFVRDAVMAVFLLIIFVYDLRYSYILDKYSIPAMVLALVFNLALGAEPLNILLGGFLIGGFFAFQFLVSNGKWIGGGDIRMGMLMGFLLGLELGVVALFIAYILGAIIGIFLITFKKRAVNSQVPFGTFLALGTVIAMIWGNSILEWYLGLLG
jgi:prepilin signal peptidase PulO-like enzyme (type II secretory pathway)